MIDFTANPDPHTASFQTDARGRTFVRADGAA